MEVGMRELHDYVLFMGNTGLRPDEAARLEYRDVKIVKDREFRGKSFLRSKFVESAASVIARARRGRSVIHSIADTQQARSY